MNVEYLAVYATTPAPLSLARLMAPQSWRGGHKACRCRIMPMILHRFRGYRQGSGQVFLLRGIGLYPHCAGQEFRARFSICARIMRRALGLTESHSARSCGSGPSDATRPTYAPLDPFWCKTRLSALVGVVAEFGLEKILDDTDESPEQRQFWWRNA